MRKTLSLFVVMVFVFAMGGCVSSSKFEKKTAEADALSKDMKTLQQQYRNLTEENNALKDQHKKLTGEFAQVSVQRDKVTADRDELDRVLKAKSDSLSKMISDLREKNGELEAENASLKESLAGLKKSKEEEVKTVSKTYESLMQEMKGEIAHGQITITELKGKLTLDVVDKILFASGEAEVKPEGLAVLQRVIEVVKNVKDKAIRIEGHTDNVKIGGVLARKYPTNWELSAARALNVARYLQKQGIDPALLAAVAYGEYKPVADNSTPEGRAKNRRIAIILQPKD
ncbi:MAG: chemotaxis protein MotB [Deltaproteobacteria bacterium HGW-Deltaproteobacteria-9]|nr:MAG: chemotaxis protein MotB [Deltaproteobacteria bacterium HGW-Deltaproteobacteria-9]